MKSSIRFKLLLYMIVNIVFFAVLLFGSNALFAEKYYLSHKKSTLIESSQRVSEIVAGKTNSADFTDDTLNYEIRTVEKSIGATIFIGTSDGTLYYPQRNNRGAPPKPDFEPNPFYLMDNEESIPPMSLSRPPNPHGNVRILEQYDENSLFLISKDPDFKIDTLRYQTQLDNGVLLLVWVPMTGISESVSISNNFTAIIGLITILITGVWALFISGKFTRPITEMSNITKKMSELDFTQTLNIDGQDEIGQLSHSINHLSSKLDETISELNTRNKQLEQDIDRERKMDKMRREFVSNVSHELKTPIFLIQGYSEGLKANIAADEKKREFYCDVIMEETEKMHILVKDLLTLSQIESGVFPVKKSNFNASLLIRDVISKYEPVLDDKDIDISLEIAEELRANADPVRVEQVIVNFMNNAVNHIDQNKIIKLTAKTTLDHKIRVSIYNSGQPIPADSFDKIWTSFYKVDEARTREYGGTGLGLSIVRAIQEAHASRYGAANVENGVEFWFEMDMA